MTKREFVDSLRNSTGKWISAHRVSRNIVLPKHLNYSYSDELYLHVSNVKDITEVSYMPRFEMKIDKTIFYDKQKNKYIVLQDPFEFVVNYNFKGTVLKYWLTKQKEIIRRTFR